MDMNMPGIGGLEATKKLLRVNPDIKIIVLTVHTENPFPTKVMQAVPQVISRRARHRMKWSMRSVLFTAVSVTFSRNCAAMALSQFSPASENPFADLSERELQIMLMITKGQKVTDISEQLSLSPKPSTATATVCSPS